jgi:2-polyprenyl-3-methyl-5-hydroxy-6-metoxy-1,4-benzoquinol methylase
MTNKKYIPHAWETVNCPFCNSNKTKLHEKYGCDLQFTYVRCLDCELIYQSPRPKYDEIFLKDAYADYYMYSDGYTYSEKVLNGWDKELKEILKFDKNKTAILDIGSGMGDFLKVAKKYYDHCDGVDVSEIMADFAQKELGLKVYLGSYPDLDFGKKYSCIHMSHVLEHIPNPKEWLAKTKEILTDDGVLAMSVPNMNSMDRRVKLFLKRMGLTSGRWKDISKTPDHLFEPTIPSTLKFFEENGFKVLEYYSYSRKDMDANTLFGKIYNRTFKFGSNLRFFAIKKQ